MKRVAPPRPRVRNQRVSNPRQRKQQHLLDVRVRSHKAVQHRNRRIFVVGSKAVLCLFGCAALFYGIRYGAKQLFFENPDYRLSKIEVQTDGTLKREQILKAAELREGENIFSVNLARVQERLQKLPQVDEVQVMRKMPSEIDVQIVERKPVAWITAAEGVSNLFARMTTVSGGRARGDDAGEEIASGIPRTAGDRGSDERDARGGQDGGNTGSEGRARVSAA